MNKLKEAAAYGLIGFTGLATLGTAAEAAINFDEIRINNRLATEAISSYGPVARTCEIKFVKEEGDTDLTKAIFISRCVMRDTIRGEDTTVEEKLDVMGAWHDEWIGDKTDPGRLDQWLHYKVEATKRFRNGSRWLSGFAASLYLMTKSGELLEEVRRQKRIETAMQAAKEAREKAEAARAARARRSIFR